MGRHAGQSVRLYQIAVATVPGKKNVDPLAHAAAFSILTDYARTLPAGRPKETVNLRRELTPTPSRRPLRSHA